MALPATIHTYHCICTSLLLATTHTLSALPVRSTATSPTSSPDIILPLPASPPTFPSPSSSPSPTTASNEQDMPPEGHSILTGMAPEKRATIIRREDGFEKRVVWRCERCRVGVGYELLSPLQSGGQAGDGMELDGGSGGKGKGREGEAYEERVIYLLPGGIMSTDVMMGKGKRVEERDVEIKSGGVAVFE